MWSEEPYAGEVQGPLRQQLEQGRKPPCGARRLDPVVSLVLGEMEGSGAVREHGRVALAQVETPGIELRDVRHEGRRRRALRVGEAPHRGPEIGVREAASGECFHSVPSYHGNVGRDRNASRT